MRLTEDIYLVGSAEFGLSNAYDCHVYLLDGGEEATLIDCGVGYDTGQIIRNIEKYIENIKEIGSNVPSYISSIEDFINNILEKDDVSKFINTAGIKVNIDMYIDNEQSLICKKLDDECRTYYIISKNTDVSNSISYRWYLSSMKHRRSRNHSNDF